MNHDDLQDARRSFIAAHDLPEPRYVTSILFPSGGGAVSMHFDQTPDELQLALEWKKVGSESPFMSADLDHEGVSVGVIARYEAGKA